jgi:hypothetical protein
MPNCKFDQSVNCAQALFCQIINFGQSVNYAKASNTLKCKLCQIVNLTKHQLCQIKNFGQSINCSKSKILASVNYAKASIVPNEQFWPKCKLCRNINYAKV